MFTQHRQREEKANITGAVAGYDLGAASVQISYCLPGAAQPETVSQVAGEEQFMIPALLAKCTDRDLWLYGSQAQESVRRNEAVPVDNLLNRAAAGSPVWIAEESYDPVALLSLFLKRTLSLLTPVFPPRLLQAFVFTVEEVTKPVVDALQAAVALLELPAEQVYVIGRAESFFYYNISQPEELWQREVLLCDFTQKQLKTMIFWANRKTTPVASFVDEKEWEEIQDFERTGDEVDDTRCGMKLDQKFTAMLNGLLADRQVATVYLIGAGFDGEWYREALPVLCRNRRVFLGNNLYSKGACYAALQRLIPGGIDKGYAFLGKDMLRANVGMDGKRCGKEVYLALLDAGTNWYEAKAECDFLLEDNNLFSLRITPLSGGQAQKVQVALTGLPQRPAYTTRIHMKVDMTDVTHVRISMEDLGFGEFFPATHKFWEESVCLESDGKE